MEGQRTIMDVLFSKENLIHAISGATGSVVAMSTFYPLDIVRTYQQVGFPGSSQPRVNFSTDKRKPSMDKQKWFAVIQDIVSRQGIGALYNGLGAVNKSLCASNFVYFYAYHALKNVLKNSSKEVSIGPHLNLLLAMCAGVINVLITTPLWVANTRIKLQGAKCVRAGDKDYYTGLVDCLHKIGTREGVGALWAGTSPSLLLVLNPAIHWAVYETLKDVFKTNTKKNASLYLFVIGAMAKCVAAVLTYPLQLLQSRLRAQMKNNGNKDASKIDSDNQLRLSMTEYFLEILRTQGLKGLFKGLEVKLWQTVLTAAFMFTIYEKLNSTILSFIQSKQT